MAAAPITPVVAVRTGISYALTAAAADGNYFTNDGKQVVLVANGGGSPITATFVTSATVDSQAVADRTVSVGAGASLVIGPFPRYVYGDTVNVTYSGVTSVTVQVITVTPEVV